MADRSLAPCPWCGLLVRLPHASEDECIHDLRAAIAQCEAKLKSESQRDPTERPSRAIPRRTPATKGGRQKQ